MPTAFYFSGMICPFGTFSFSYEFLLFFLLLILTDGSVKILSLLKIVFIPKKLKKNYSYDLLFYIATSFFEYLFNISSEKLFNNSKTV